MAAKGRHSSSTASKLLERLCNHAVKSNSQDDLSALKHVLEEDASAALAVLSTLKHK